MPQRSFAKVQPLAVFASSLQNQVDMRMGFVGMQSHHIAVLKCELLPGEISYRRQDFSGGVPAGMENMSL